MTILCAARNPLVFDETADPWQETMIPGETVSLEIILDRPVQAARDERTGQDLGDGQRFEIPWTANEAAVISFANEDTGGPKPDR